MSYSFIELFSGSGNISRAFKDCGFKTFSIDNRKRSGVCEPDLRADVLKLSLVELEIYGAVNVRSSCNVLYAGVPCNAFSNAAGNYYRDGTGYKESTHYFQKLLRKTLELIEEIKPDFYIIENPRASLRYNKTMIDFLSRTRGTICTTSLGSYGFETNKPTDLFTNYQALELRPLMKWGKGAKNVGRSFDNLTTHQRAATPYALGFDIAHQLKNYLDLKIYSGLSNLRNFQLSEIAAKNLTSLDSITDTIGGPVISKYL